MPTAAGLQPHAHGIQGLSRRQGEWKKACRISHLVEIKDSLKGEKVSRSVNQSEVGINNSTTPAASPICHIKNEIVLIVCLSTKTQL